MHMCMESEMRTEDKVDTAKVRQINMGMTKGWRYKRLKW
jgi:hypothetical protein